MDDEPEKPSTIIPGAKIEDLDEEDDLPEASMIGKGKGRKNKVSLAEYARSVRSVAPLTLFCLLRSRWRSTTRTRRSSR